MEHIVVFPARDANTVAAVLARLDGALGINADRNVSFGELGDFRAAVSILVSVARFSKETPDVQRTKIVRSAVLDSKKAGALTLADVGRRIERGERSYLSLHPRPFILLTSISARYSKILAAVKLDDATIAFSRFPPGKFTRPESIAQSRIQAHPSTYSAVRVKVTQRDPYSAGDRALSRLDLLRGLWNYHLNYRLRRFFLGAHGERAVNVIVLGPIHTVHDLSGKSSIDEYWFEPRFDDRIQGLVVDAHYAGLKRFERWARNRIQLCSFGEVLEEIFIRYARALDERDLTNAFLRMWSILEDLTATGYGNHKVTVRRASYLFKDYEYRRLVLENLRSLRNRMVHDGYETVEGERLVYEAKTYVETLLDFILKHLRLFKSLEDVGCLLNLPVDHEFLRMSLRHHKVALGLHP